MMLILTIAAIAGGIAETTFMAAGAVSHRAEIKGDRCRNAGFRHRHRPPKSRPLAARGAPHDGTS